MVCLEKIHSNDLQIVKSTYVNESILVLPWQIFPSKPVSQIQVPTESSQFPFPEHVPSPGQSNSKQKGEKIREISQQFIQNHNFELKVLT